MYAVIFCHISIDDHTPDKIKVISKHRTEDAAIKAMRNAIPKYLGWPDPKEYYKEFPEEWDSITENGFFRHDDDEYLSMDFVDYWQVVEI